MELSIPAGPISTLYLALSCKRRLNSQSDEILVCDWCYTIVCYVIVGCVMVRYVIVCYVIVYSPGQVDTLQMNVALGRKGTYVEKWIMVLC